MFNNYARPIINETTYEDLTVIQKKILVDHFAEGGTIISAKHLCLGISVSVLHEALDKVKKIESFCISNITEEDTIETLNDKVYLEFPDCNETALNYLINKMITYSNGKGTGDFTFWKNGVLGI